MSSQVRLDQLGSLSGFIDASVKAGVRLVKLKEYGFVAPGDIGGGVIGMLGQHRFILTAFIKRERLILRWEQVVAARGVTGNEPAGLDGRRIRALLEIEGIQVVEGEWKPAELAELLDVAPL